MLTDIPLAFLTGVHGDSFTILQSPEFVSFQKGDWPVSGEKIPDLVALTMGFSVQEVCCYWLNAPLFELYFVSREVQI